jgi:hypothetical protein
LRVGEEEQAFDLRPDDSQEVDWTDLRLPTERSASSNPGGDPEKISGVASTRALGWNLTWTGSCTAFIASGKLRGPTSHVTTRSIPGRQLRRASSHQWTIAA